MIANSSPLSRPTVSPGRTAARSRAATWRSSSSPAAWPRVSLTCLNRSRSQKRTADVGAVGRPSAMRLDEPVEEEHAVRQAGERVVRGLVAAPSPAAGPSAVPSTAWSPTPRRRARTSPSSWLGASPPAQPAVATPRNVVPASRGTATTSAVPMAVQQAGAGPGCSSRCWRNRGSRSVSMPTSSGMSSARSAVARSRSVPLVGQPDRGVRAQRPGRRVPQQDAGAAAADDAGQRLATTSRDGAGVGRGGQLVGQREQGPGPVRLLAGVLERDDQVERRGGVAGVRGKHRGLVAHGAVAGAGRWRPAGRACGGRRRRRRRPLRARGRHRRAGWLAMPGTSSAGSPALCTSGVRRRPGAGRRAGRRVRGRPRRRGRRCGRARCRRPRCRRGRWRRTAGSAAARAGRAVPDRRRRAPPRRRGRRLRRSQVTLVDAGGVTVGLALVVLDARRRAGRRSSGRC